MYFASSVATAVAPGTPGSWNVTTGLPACHATDVVPTLSRPSWSSVPGLAPHQSVSLVPASAALGAPCGLAQMRISRSCTAFAIGTGLPLVAPISAPTTSSFQAYGPLTTSMFEAFCPPARVQAS